MSFKRILVPLDGSSLAEKALIPALFLAKALSAKILLVRATIPLTLNLDPKLYKRTIKLRQDEAERYLQTIQSRFLSLLVDIETQVLVGHAAELIIKCAQEKEIDLIVMSSHGRTGFSRLIHGSVAEKVLHTASCAKAIIYPQVIIEPFSIKRILVTLDGSSLAEQALGPALALTKAMSAELVLLGVTRSQQISEQWVPFLPSPDAVIETDEFEVKRYLRRVQVSMKDSPVFVSTLVPTNFTAEGIIEIAASHQIDLIVICGHDYSGIRRWGLGNVAENILRGVNCAILFIHNQEASK